MNEKLPPHIKTLRLLAKAAHGHAGKCKEHLDECSTCQRNIKWFASLSTQDLSLVLAE